MYLVHFLLKKTQKRAFVSTARIPPPFFAKPRTFNQPIKSRHHPFFFQYLHEPSIRTWTQIDEDGEKMLHGKISRHANDKANIYHVLRKVNSSIRYYNGF